MMYPSAQRSLDAVTPVIIPSYPSAGSITAVHYLIPSFHSSTHTASNIQFWFICNEPTVALAVGLPIMSHDPQADIRYEGSILGRKLYEGGWRICTLASPFPQELHSLCIPTRYIPRSSLDIWRFRLHLAPIRNPPWYVSWNIVDSLQPVESQGWAQVKTTCVVMRLIEIVHSAEERSHFLDSDDDDNSTIKAR
jgi:hypothetical protein